MVAKPRTASTRRRLLLRSLRLRPLPLATLTLATLELRLLPLPPLAPFVRRTSRGIRCTQCTW